MVHYIFFQDIFNNIKVREPVVQLFKAELFTDNKGKTRCQVGLFDGENLATRILLHTTVDVQQFVNMATFTIIKFKKYYLRKHPSDGL